MVQNSFDQMREQVSISRGTRKDTRVNSIHLTLCSGSRRVSLLFQASDGAEVGSRTNQMDWRKLQRLDADERLIMGHWGCLIETSTSGYCSHQVSDNLIWFANLFFSRQRWDQEVISDRGEVTEKPIVLSLHLHSIGHGLDRRRGSYWSGLMISSNISLVREKKIHIRNCSSLKQLNCN